MTPNPANGAPWSQSRPSHHCKAPVRTQEGQVCSLCPVTRVSAGPPRAHPTPTRPLGRHHLLSASERRGRPHGLARVSGAAAELAGRADRSKPGRGQFFSGFQPLPLQTPSPAETAKQLHSPQQARTSSEVRAGKRGEEGSLRKCGRAGRRRQAELGMKTALTPAWVRPQTKNLVS